MAQYQKVSTPVPVNLYLFRNAALYEDRPHLSRLVVGGAAHGQVLVSQQVELVITVPKAMADLLRLVERANGDVPNTSLEIEQVRYSAGEVMIGDRIYRTWRRAHDSDEVHVMMTLSALADARPESIETCRAA